MDNKRQQLFLNETIEKTSINELNTSFFVAAYREQKGTLSLRLSDSAVKIYS